MPKSKTFGRSPDARHPQRSHLAAEARVGCQLQLKTQPRLPTLLMRRGLPVGRAPAGGMG